ncbi:Gfo/Idh/MocA family oxidoreductase [Candidatus Poribacteria bacterium]|nr:Gfo/Idh/MocA family oxidoreductase [Candidatus Poribacteria bacterium]
MSKLSIAIIGSGGMANHHARELAQESDVTIALVASRNRETGEALAHQHEARYAPQWEDAIADGRIDAVVVCTHNASHGEIILGALGAGKHVLSEYPLARSIEEGREIVRQSTDGESILRLTHSETVSGMHRALRRESRALGSLLLSSFVRLTPGRGSRPEVLFNLPVSGPPAHFFIYHVYPVVDPFGPAAWVDASCIYEGLQPDGRYDRFVNVVTAGMVGGGIAQWTWAGGIEIDSAKQEVRYVMSDGTLHPGGDGWVSSRRDGSKGVHSDTDGSDSLYAQWLREIRNGETARARADALTAFEAINLSLSAERAMAEGQRAVLGR